MPVAIPLAIVGAGIAGAAISSSAAKSAAKTEAAAANQATSVQQQMYGQTREDLGQFRDFGGAAQGSLGRLLGFNADGSSTTSAPAPQVGDPNIGAWLKANPDVEKYYNATPEARTVDLNTFAQDVAKQQSNIRSAVPTYSQQDVADYRTPMDQELENLPGYRFARDQGVQQVNRSLGSMGLTGAQAKGISRFVTGLADQTYGNQVDRLQRTVNTGESAAAQTGAAGASYAGGISNTITGAGTASAAGTVGAANAASAGLSSIPSALLFNKLFSGDSGGAAGGGAGIYTGAGTEGADLG